MGGSSAHGGQYDLLRWYHAIAGSRVQVALIPGEDRGRNALAEIIRQRHGRRPLLPVQGDAIEL